MLKFVFCDFIFLWTQSAWWSMRRWSSCSDIMFRNVTNFSFVCYKGVVSVIKFFINSCSPLAAGIVELIPVDMCSEVIPFAVSFVSLSMRKCVAISTEMLYRSQPATHNRHTHTHTQNPQKTTTNKPHFQEAMSHWCRQPIAIYGLVVNEPNRPI